MTLPELLIAAAVTAMIGLTLASLTYAVNVAHDHITGRATATQHARVALERMRGTIDTAYGNEVFPACVVFADTVGTNHFPDTLVVWQPTTTAANPTGLPRYSELVMYTPSATNPGKLVECTYRGNSTTAPALSNTSAWFTLINTFRTSTLATQLELTDLVRTAAVASSTTGTSTTQRAALRFNVLVTPSETEVTQFRAGTLAWNNLRWPLDLRGANVGVRRVVCQVEMQLVPRLNANAADTVPFFGSFPVTYTLTR